MAPAHGGGPPPSRPHSGRCDRRGRGVGGGRWSSDEADIIGTVIRHLLAQGVERVLIADNNCPSDGTEASSSAWPAPTR